MDSLEPLMVFEWPLTPHSKPFSESLKVILRGIEQSIKCIGRSPRLD